MRQAESKPSLFILSHLFVADYYPVWYLLLKKFLAFARKVACFLWVIVFSKQTEQCPLSFSLKGMPSFGEFNKA